MPVFAVGSDGGSGFAGQVCGVRATPAHCEKATARCLYACAYTLAFLNLCH
jgi:hypothetical protein